MTAQLNIGPASVGRSVSALAGILSELDSSKKAWWTAYHSFVYGDLTGQRRLDLDKLKASFGQMPPSVSANDICISVEIVYATMCSAVCIATRQPDPEKYLASLQSLSAAELKAFFRDLYSGIALKEAGLRIAADLFELSWLPEYLSDEPLEAFRDLLRLTNELYSQFITRYPGVDPLQRVHSALFPKNLLHVSGQFFTPQWMAEWLLDLCQWAPDKRLIDPFCGSGVILLTAAKRALELGLPIEEYADQLCGIDVSPSSVLTSITNFAILSRKHSSKLCPSASAIPLLLCADALSPVLSDANDAEGGLFANEERSIWMGGNRASLSSAEQSGVVAELENDNPPRKGWFGSNWPARSNRTFTSASRAAVDTTSTLSLLPADLLVTNPPWVGWEYMSRPYRLQTVPAWKHYGLYQHKGRDASFLKEDLSTLCLVAAWDRYLQDEGRSSVVLRPSAMYSELAARGLRRLSLFPASGPISLERIDHVVDFPVFETALTDTAIWTLRKSSPTKFPVKTMRWKRSKARWRPSPETSLAEVREHSRSEDAVTLQVNKASPTSRWTTHLVNTTEGASKLLGENTYKARLGIFTGGANAVFYLEPQTTADSSPLGLFRTVTERAKRALESRIVSLERELIYPLVRGRDLSFWNASSSISILCPHTAASKMQPIDPEILAEKYPAVWSYLSSCEDFLRARQGFAGWERHILDKYFYAAQRIGDYTFAPYKVCWRYIASSFVVAVVEATAEGKAVMPNDKVVFLPFNNREEAYFVAALLSSVPVATHVLASGSTRQLSPSIIRGIRLPRFDKDDLAHGAMAKICAEGHQLAKDGKLSEVMSRLEEIDFLSGDVLGVTSTEIKKFRADARTVRGEMSAT